MESILRMTTRKPAGKILCYFLCLAVLLLTFVIDYQEAQAFFPAIIIGGVLIPEAVVVISGLLAAAGIGFTTYQGAKAVSQWYYDDVQPAVREKLIVATLTALDAITDEGAPPVAYVDTELWAGTRDWVNSRFYPGYNEIYAKSFTTDYTAHVGDQTYVTRLPVNYNVIVGEIPWAIHSAFTIGTDVYTYVLSEYIGQNKNFRVYKNGVAQGMSYTINTTVDWFYFLEVEPSYDTYNLRLKLIYAGYNEMAWKSTPATVTTIYGSDYDATISPGIPGVNPIDYSATGEAVVGTQHDMLANDGTTRAFWTGDITTPETSTVGRTKENTVIQDLSQIGNPPVEVEPYSNSWEGSFRDCAPTGDYTFTGTGTATPSLTAEGTWTGVWTEGQEGQRIWTGTYEDAQGNTWNGTAEEAIAGGGEISTGWLQGLLEGFWQLLVGTLADIKAAIEGVASPIVDAVAGAASAVGAKVQDVVDAIAGVAENTAEADMTDRIKQFKIPDLFLLILKVILACIRLMLRAMIFIATLPTIPASAGDINGNFLSGVNFLKNQTIPYFGVSVWSMASGVVAIFFGLAIVKRIRRIYSV